MKQEEALSFDRFLEKYKISSQKAQHKGGQGKIYVNDSKTVFTKVTKEISLFVFTKKPQYVVNIINIFDSQEYCHAMEYGQSDLLKTYQQCNMFQKLAIMHQMTLAVKEIHDLNIIHRDVKLENFIQFRRNNRIIYKLTDFGISQFPEDNSQDSCGTYYIMAPEQFQLNCKYDQTIDNWALGSNFYTMITTKPLINSKSKEDAQYYLKTINNKQLKDELIKVNGEFLTQIICGLLKTVPKDRMNLNQVLAELESLILKNPDQVIKQHKISIVQDSTQCQSFMGVQDKILNNQELINYYPQIVDPNNKDVNTLSDETQLQFESINIWNFDCYKQPFRIKVLQFATIILRSTKKKNTLKEVKKAYQQFCKIDDFPIIEIYLKQLQSQSVFIVDLVSDILSEFTQYGGQETVISRNDYNALIVERNLLYQEQLKKLQNYEHIFHRFIKSKQKTTELKYTYCLNFDEPFQQLPGFFKGQTFVPSPYNVLYYIPQEWIVEEIDYKKINDFLKITYLLIQGSQQLSQLGYQFHPISNNIIKYRKNLNHQSIYECLPTNIIVLQDIREEEMIKQIFLHMLQHLQNQDINSFLRQNGCEQFMGFYDKGMSNDFFFKDLQEFKQKLETSLLLSEQESQIFQDIKPDIQKIDSLKFKFQLEQRQLLSNQLNSLVFIEKIISIDSVLAKQSKSINHFLQTEIIGRIQNFRPFQSIKLLYRASRDKLIYESFSEQCFNKGRFLMLLQTSYGEIIGGYTPLELLNENKRQFDNSTQTFIFSLTKNEIYPFKQQCDQAIISSYHQWNKFYYFHFGEFDIFFTIPHSEIEAHNPVNFKSNFPNNFETEQYPHIPESHDDDNKEQYLIGGCNDNKQCRGKSKILELEVFGFEDL